MDDRLVHLANQVAPRGRVIGSDLLLTPPDAIHLLTELPAAVMVLGCQGWRADDLESPRGSLRVIQAPAATFYVESCVPYIDLWPRLSADLVMHYLRTQLPPTCEFVSLLYEDAEVAALFAPVTRSQV